MANDNAILILVLWISALMAYAVIGAFVVVWAFEKAPCDDPRVRKLIFWFWPVLLLAIVWVSISRRQWPHLRIKSDS